MPESPQSPDTGIDLSALRLLIDGQWIESAGDQIPVVNPSDGTQVTTVPDATADEVDRAVRAARTALEGWRHTNPFERAKILHRLAGLVREHQDRLAMLVTIEMGKPLAEARGEAAKLADALDYYAEEAVRVQGRTVPNDKDGFVSIVRYEPIGVVGAISPWNYPLELIGWKLAAALAAGCTIVLKPSEVTPSSAVALFELLAEAGVPDGVANLVLGGGGAGRALTSHPGLDKVAFTGSTATGIAIGQSLTSPIATSMELGGSCPMIVTANADIDKAVAGALRRGFRNAGQICIAINRIYVHESVHEAFTRALADGVRALRVGPGIEDPDVGPVVDEQIRQRVADHVRDAVERGATVVAGGEPIERPGTYVSPTLVDNVDPASLLATVETFGPVVGITGYDRTEDAIAMANGTGAGLAAYLYTTDLAETFEIGHRLDFGNVAVNNPDAGIMNAPYGGRKDSGHGHEHGPEGLHGYLTIKHLRIGFSS